jgi:hypothetical protein
VNLTCVDPSRRVYVRRINVVGNTRTRDEVVRREMRQLESSWFDSSRLALSKDRVNRLGYFTNVDVTTVPVEGTNDQVDVNVKVDEKPTGAITLGAGFSSTDKVVLSAGVSQDNVFGSGTSLSVNVNTAKSYRTLRHAGRPVLHGRRHQADHRRLLPHVPAAVLLDELELPHHQRGRQPEVRHSVLGSRHGLFRRGLRAEPSRRRFEHAAELPSTT